MLTNSVPSYAPLLAEAFWPGPLTMVMQRGDAVPDNVSSGLPTVAVRMPIHPVARALIEAAGTPIAAPSANTFTRPSATTAAHVLEDLYGRVERGDRRRADAAGTRVDGNRPDVNPPVVLAPAGGWCWKIYGGCTGRDTRAAIRR